MNINILNPPKSYIDWRCVIHAWEENHQNSKEEFDSIKRKFYGNDEYKNQESEILEFCKELNEARQDRSLLFEKREIREKDGKTYGHVVSMMIYDIQYWREKGQIKSRKIYMAEQGEL